MALAKRVSSASSGVPSAPNTPDLSHHFHDYSGRLNLNPTPTQQHYRVDADQLVFKSSSTALLRAKVPSRIPSRQGDNETTSFLDASDHDQNTTTYLAGARRVLGYMYRLWKTGRLCDVIIQTDGGELQTHKIVLAAYSEALEEQLHQFPQGEIISIDLTDASRKAVFAVLRFLYTMDIYITDHNIGPILFCATELGIEAVIKLCITHLNSTTEANAVTAYCLAEEHNLDEVRRKTREYIIQNLAKIVHGKAFARLAVEKLLILFSDDRLAVPSEMDIFFAAVHWVDQNRGERLPLAATLLRCVRFQLIPCTLPLRCRKLDTVECYESSSNEWRMLTRMPCGAKIGAAVAVFQDHLFIVGGYNNERANSTVLADVECFDLQMAAISCSPTTSMISLAMCRWVQRDPLPYPRCHANLVVVGGRMFLIGGRTKIADVKPVVVSLSSVDEYNTATGTSFTRQRQLAAAAKHHFDRVRRLLKMADNTYRGADLQMPSRDQIAELSNELGLDIGDQVSDYHDLVCGMLKNSYSGLDKFQEPKLPVKYPRTPGYRPSAEENSHNAWYYKTEIPGASSGKLFGKRVVIKDCIPVAGVPMMNGSRVLEGYVPDYDPTVVTRILDAGAVIAGKSACEDFCFSGHSFTSVYGPVLNPHDKTRSAGGSSNGSAVLVALGEVDMALGGDQGGSIRLPACWNGIVGHKPTYGLVPFTGIGSLAPAADHVGPMARTVHDCALLLEAIAGYDDGLDPRQTSGKFDVPVYTEHLTGDLTGVKIGLVIEGFEDCKEDVAELVQAAADSLKQRGATVQEVSIPLHRDGEHIWGPMCIDGAYHAMVEGAGHFVGPPGYMATSAIEAMTAARTARGRDFSPAVKTVALVGKYVSDRYGLRFYAKSQNLLRMLRGVYDEKLKQFDVLVMPTIKFKAPKHPPSDIGIKELVPMAVNSIQNTTPFNGTGHPACSINVATSGLPVGMMIVGRHFDDKTVLKVAHAYEQIRDSK